MKCSEIIDILEGLAPTSIACDWDNPGLLAGRSDKEVHTVLLALDATDEVVEEAATVGADLLLTHHPLIFKAIKKINDQDFVGRRLMRLIGNDISYYAMHTNFDAAPGCMADLAAERLGLAEQSALEPMGTVSIGEWQGRLPGARPELERLTREIHQSGAKEFEYGIGKIGSLEAEMTLEALIGRVKRIFDLPFVTVYGSDNFALTAGTANLSPEDRERDKSRMVRRIAVCPGAGGSTMRAALLSGADVYITGDVSHHEGIDAAACGMAVIDAGHYGIEHIFMEFMETFLKDRLGGDMEIRRAKSAIFPSRVY